MLYMKLKTKHRMYTSLFVLLISKTCCIINFSVDFGFWLMRGEYPMIKQKLHVNRLFTVTLALYS